MAACLKCALLNCYFLADKNAERYTGEPHVSLLNAKNDCGRRALPGPRCMGSLQSHNATLRPTWGCFAAGGHGKKMKGKGGRGHGEKREKR